MTNIAGCGLRFVTIASSCTSLAVFLEYGCGPGDQTLALDAFCENFRGAAITEPNVPISDSLYDIFLVGG